MSRYPDLKHLNESEALQHYEIYGIKEKRILGINLNENLILNFIKNFMEWVRGFI